MEKLETNRLVEDKKFYDHIFDLILEELEDLSRIYDQGNAESGYGKIWAEKIAKIKTGDKLGAEDEVRKIVLDIGQKSRLSSAELHYLFSLIFKPRKPRIDED